MSKRSIVLAAMVACGILLFIIIAFVLTGLPVDIEDPVALYEAAIQSIPNTYHLSVEKVTTTTVSDAVYTEHSNITLHRQMANQNDLIKLEETVTSGNYVISICEIYTNREIYMTVQGCNFKGHTDQQGISKRYIPAAMFNVRKYQNITGTKENGVIAIQFTAPTDAEIWAIPSGAKLIDAAGTAIINRTGELVKSDYKITYSLNAITVSAQYFVTLETEELETITPPENPDDYTLIDCIDTPIVMERISGIITQFGNVSSTIEESMYCGAFGDSRDTSYAITINNREPFEGEITTTIQPANGSLPLQINNSTTHTEHIYTADSAKIDQCYDLLLSGIPEPKYIRAIEYVENRGEITIECTPIDEYGKYLTEYICDTLYESPDIVISRSSSHTVETLSYAITLDQQTYLPKKITLAYHSRHIIDGVSYPVDYTWHQTFNTQKAGA